MNFDETVFRMLRKNRMKSYFLAQIPYFPPKIQLNPVLWFMIRPSSFPIYKVKNFRSIVHGARVKKAHSNIKPLVSSLSHLLDLGNMPFTLAFCLLRRKSSSGCLSMLASGGLTGGDIGGDSDEKLFCRFDLSPLRSRW